MEIEFNFREEPSKILGLIKRPVVRIILINGEMKVPEYLYVDSGADITLITKSLGDLLGFKVKPDDKIDEIKGIGDLGIPIIIKKINMQIGEIIFDTRIAWSLTEEVPLLLGRTDVFNIFDVCFNKNKKTVFKN